MDVAGRKRELLNAGFPRKALEKTARSRGGLPPAETYRRKVAELVGAGFWKAKEMFAKAPGLIGHNASALVAKAAALKDEGIADPVRLLEKNPDLAGLSEARLRRRFEELRGLGFPDPAKMIEAAPNVLSYRPERIAASVGALRDAGLPDPVRALGLFPSLLRYAPKSLADKASALLKLGVTPASMSRFPGMLGLDTDAVAGKIAHLERKLGAGQGLRATRLRPELLGMPTSTINGRLAASRKAGMSGAKGAMAALGRSQNGLDATYAALESVGLDAEAIMKRAPSVVSLSAASFPARLMALKGAGIPDPLTAVRRMPTVLTLSAKSVRARVDWLLAWGFREPGTMAERAPGILAAKTETLNGRVEEIMSWDGEESGLRLAEKEPALLASSPDKLRTIGAALEAVGGASSGIVRGLLWCSPLEIAYSLTERPESANGLLTGARRAKKIGARTKTKAVAAGAAGRGPRAKCCRSCLAWLEKRNA